MNNGTLDTSGKPGTTAPARAATELDIRVVAGGALDAVEESALVLAVRQVLAAREGRQRHRGSAWARAGRLEALRGNRLASPQQFSRADD